MKDEADTTGQSLGFENVEKLAKAQAQLRANATPAQRRLLEAADEAFAKECDEFDQRLEMESKVRQWAETICGASLDFSEIESLQAKAKAVKPGLFIFAFKRKPYQVQLVKTQFGTIDRVENYVGALERAIIDVTNASQFTALPFWGLIKLAFRRAIKRN